MGERAITGLLRSAMTCSVEAKKDIAERIRLLTELDKDRGKESAGILFFFVSEVEKKVCYVCRTSFGGAFDILDDCRTSEYSTILVTLSYESHGRT